MTCLLTPNVVAGIELRYDHFGADYVNPSRLRLPATCLATIEDSVTAGGEARLPRRQQYADLRHRRWRLRRSVASIEGFGVDEVTEGVGGYVLALASRRVLMDSVTASLDARYFRATRHSSPRADGVSSSSCATSPSPQASSTASAAIWALALPETIVDPVDYDFSGPRLSLAVLGGAGSMERDIATPVADVGPFWSEGVGASIGAGFDFAIADDWVIGLDASLDYLPMTFEDPDQDNPDVGATD